MERLGKKKVLVTYMEAGMGHIVTAQAIAEALEAKYSEELEIVNNYTLRDSGNQLLEKYEKFMVNQVKAHSAIPGYCFLQMASMHIIGSKNTLKFVHRTVFYRQTKATIEEYKKQRPDVIVCTHYFLLFAATEYRNKYNKDCKVVLYCPDNMVHGWWDNRIDKIYTNCDNATKNALRFKFPKENILQVFFPTRAAVSASNEPKEVYRDKFGIPKDKFAIVIADGAYAKAKTKKVTRALLESDVPLTLCVIAGKNEKFLTELQQIKEKTKSNITLMPFGYVQDAPQLYGACDLFITKAGPNAMLDSVMMGTPVIIDYYASPIEKASKELFADQKKCGYYITNISGIRKKAEFLATNPDAVEQLDKNLLYFDKKRNGAEEIADDIASLVGIEKKERITL